MKKFCLIFVCLVIPAIFLSACTIDNGEETIKYKRKLEKYFPSEQKSGGAIDLSDGPKLRYDASFGPRDLNFDIKIVNPY